MLFVAGPEIEIPKELRPFMMSRARPTRLGQKKGAKRQYRYGNLHIREYDHKYTVHTDSADPRRDPLGHLVHDAPEVLVGLGCAMLGGARVSAAFGPPGISVAAGLASACLLGGAGYLVARKLKDILGG